MNKEFLTVLRLEKFVKTWLNNMYRGVGGDGLLFCTEITFDMWYTPPTPPLKCNHTHACTHTGVPGFSDFASFQSVTAPSPQQPSSQQQQFADFGAFQSTNDPAMSQVRTAYCYLVPHNNWLVFWGVFTSYM